MPRPIRILLLHQYGIEGEVLANCLGNSNAISVLGVYADLEQATAQQHLPPPDMVLVGGYYFKCWPAELMPRIRAAWPQARVLALDLDDEERMDEWLDAGADGYVQRNASADRLLAIISRVHRGEAIFLPRGRCMQPSKPLHKQIPPLGVDILRLVDEDLSEKEIAEQLQKKLSNIRNTFAKTREVLGARNRAHALWIAKEWGLIP